MSRLLVCGIGPRPAAGQTHVFAPGLRLHTITTELIRAGYKVHLAEAEFARREKVPQPEAPVDVAGYHPLRGSTLDEWRAEITRLAEECSPDALIVLTDGMALAAAESEYDGPLYVDYNGHPMAERQMQAAVHDSNAALADQWLYVLPVLLRADRFAACSDAQRLALIGELGAAGRLNAETCGETLVDVLRPPLPFDAEFQATHAGVLRGGIVPADARIMLFTGGYNTWLDEEMLFRAVEKVLAADPRAVYVSTGGEIEGHVTAVFERFRAHVDASPHRDRYHFVGWLEHTRYVDHCLEADVGLVCDRQTLEGELGCRNRLYGWIWGGMRAVATDLAEIVRTELAPLGLVDGVRTGDAESFAAALARALQQGRCGEAEAAQRRDVLRNHCTAEVYYRPLVEWAGNPHRAADRAQDHLPRNPLVVLQRRFLELSRDDSREETAQQLAQRLKGSRAFRLYLSLHPEIEELLDRIDP